MAERRGAAHRAPSAEARTAPRRTPQQERSRARVDAILAAARGLIAQREDVSMREIAAAARVPIASIYQYFPDRDAVFRAITLEFYARIRGRLEAALSFVKHAEDLSTLFDVMIDGLAGELRQSRSHLNVWAHTQSSPVLRELDTRDALAVAELVASQFQALAPDVDPERIRDICVFAVVMAGPAVRQSFVLPKSDGERILRELKALIRSRLQSLEQRVKPG
jgi:AcrR family transcriptional regulator